jgi:hypothetical protein
MSKDVRNAADLGQDLEQQVLALALAKGGEEDLGGGGWGAKTVSVPSAFPAWKGRDWIPQFPEEESTTGRGAPS